MRYRHLHHTAAACQPAGEACRGEGLQIRLARQAHVDRLEFTRGL
jgi:hypothetical protein